VKIVVAVSVADESSRSELLGSSAERLESPDES
jgi:hypothetical protein